MAGTPNTSVDVSGMKSAQGSFQDALDEVNKSYTQMSSQISDLQASWTGDASASFLGAMETWLQDFSTVRSQLNLMFEKLQSGTGSYDGLHGETVNIASGVGKGMGLQGF
ncbi:WXG100 family type VII secretion target (plasmid) [Streptomyces sp. NBC_01527]|uniref:WXG100 family type VII secretion target n=1 Tax=unclassified Streptomyces TaxID=2593676 RepID=UPI002E116BFD|nr:WXG100 family type VII secretion target [Streptomyces sp. NBC_01230]